MDIKRTVSSCLFAVLPVLLAGCLGPATEIFPEDEDLRPVAVYLVSHGWHVGIAVEADYVTEKIPAHRFMPEATWLKFGWGDRNYYPREDPGLGLLLQAALLPSRTALHVVGIDTAVERYFAGSDVIRVQVTEEGMDRLAEFIARHFRRDGNGELLYRTDGLYSNSAFFEATGLYFVPKTSNTWTARALRQTGAPITPAYAVTSGNVVQQTRQFGDVLNRRR
ncbi:MAG: DUF2459 domain-containing protein [Balneolaceae bacterium]